jgi:quercetin dioxygenase-like cupin family protein
MARRKVLNTAMVQAGEGRSIWVVGDFYTIKASAADTGGAFALIEAIVPPQAGPPPHLHRREDEAFYVLDGELEFQVDGRRISAGAGAWVTLARGSLHTFKNVGTKPARMLIVLTPAGLENYFLEVGREAVTGPEAAVTSSPEDVEKLIATAPKYGLEIRPPNESSPLGPATAGGFGSGHAAEPPRPPQATCETAPRPASLADRNRPSSTGTTGMDRAGD